MIAMYRPRPTILIVDDEAANISVLNRLLRDDYQILFAANGPDAIELALSQNPDLLLLDIMMPGMDGCAVCVKLKNDDRSKNIPIIFVTALGAVEHETIGLELGAVDYITKPINPGILRLRVKNHLELKAQRDFLADLSCRDGLTGIANRRRFDEYMEQEWRRAIRTQSPFSLILGDIDCFKPFNDHYGHAAGDECLKKVSKTMAGTLDRPADLIARYGGEEFVGVLPDTDHDGAVNSAKKINNAVYQLQIPHAHSSVADCVTISLGVVTTIPTRNRSSVEIIKNVDEVLYVAKKEGRNRISSRIVIPDAPVEQNV